MCGPCGEFSKAHSSKRDRAGASTPSLHQIKFAISLDHAQDRALRHHSVAGLSTCRRLYPSSRFLLIKLCAPRCASTQNDKPRALCVIGHPEPRRRRRISKCDGTGGARSLCYVRRSSHKSSQCVRAHPQEISAPCAVASASPTFVRSGSGCASRARRRPPS
jgi:hypothetical protein